MCRATKDRWSALMHRGLAEEEHLVGSRDRDGTDADYVEYVRLRLSWLRRVAFLLCQDAHRADDLVQVAITQLYVHWRRIREVDNLDGYARTVLVRVYLGERRKWVSRVTLRPEVPDVAVEPVDHAGRLAVRRALADLAPRQRATVVLRFYCDLSVEQTADTLGCSPGTVKSQTAKGLDTLRRALGSQAYERS
jgi:RNA polymerase sigma-70 factor (sigma-E family)